MNKLNLYLLNILLTLYLLRVFVRYFNFEFLIYLISFILIFQNLIWFIFKIGFFKKKLIFLLIFITIGSCYFLYSFFQNGLSFSLFSFASVFMNLTIWFFVYQNNSFDTHFFKYYVKFVIFLSVINSIISIYQFFFDPSIFGTLDNIYGNSQLLNLGFVTRRTTGLLFGPQNLSIFLGFSLFVIYQFSIKFKYPILLLVAFAGFTSGSRSFGISLILFIFYLLIINYRKNRFIFTLIIITFLVSLPMLLFIVDLDARSFDFQNFSAFDIYFKTFNNFNFFNFFFGSGLGLKDWIVNSELVRFDYSSTESSFISLFVQFGLFSLLFSFLFIKPIFQSIFDKNYFVFFSTGLLFINFLTTPSFSGFPMSFLFIPFLFMNYLSYSFLHPNKIIGLKLQ